jgi:hypothetical protein
MAYWRKSPPLHILAAAYVGYKPAPEAIKSINDALPELAQSGLGANTISKTEFEHMLASKGIAQEIEHGR